MWGSPQKNNPHFHGLIKPQLPNLWVLLLQTCAKNVVKEMNLRSNGENFSPTFPGKIPSFPAYLVLKDGLKFSHEAFSFFTLIEN